MKNYLFYILFLIASISFGQTDSLDIDSFTKMEEAWAKRIFTEDYPNYVGDYDYEIIDEKLNLIYKIDSTEIYVSAIDTFGKTIWRTDPWTDNKLPIYHYNRPVIAYFKLIKIPTHFSNEEWYAEREVIAIEYTNRQFGYLDTKTGEFLFLGQD